MDRNLDEIYKEHRHELEEDGYQEIEVGTEVLNRTGVHVFSLLPSNRLRVNSPVEGLYQIVTDDNNVVGAFTYGEGGVRKFGDYRGEECKILWKFNVMRSWRWTITDVGAPE